MNHRQAARNARENKEKHPERYCPNPHCLWRTMSANSDEEHPCPKHQPTHNSEGKMLHYVDADGQPLVPDGKPGMTTDEASQKGIEL